MTSPFLQEICVLLEVNAFVVAMAVKSSSSAARFAGFTRYANASVALSATVTLHLSEANAPCVRVSEPAENTA